MQFTSTTREDVNRSVGYPANFVVPLRQIDTVRPEDPEPMIYPYTGQRASFADEALGWRYRPRPEYRPQPNPILVAMRIAPRSGEYDTDALARTYIGLIATGYGHLLTEGATVDHARSEHVDHARKVLTRLKNIYKED